MTGTFYLGAIVDDRHEVTELLESNNHTTGPPIRFGDGPDLVVTSVSGPSSTTAPFSIASTVCNQGTQPSNGLEVRFYASADAIISGNLESWFTSDVFLGSRFVDGLAPGQCDSGSIDASPPPGMGAFYPGAIVNEGHWIFELSESNNRTTGLLIRR